MGKKITQYPNNVSVSPDMASLLDLSEKTGTSTYESRKWSLSAMMTWLNANGAGGKSAYEIAVDNGFVGTEAQWLASLEGADGANGTNGTNGTNGSTPIVWTSYDGSGFTLSTGVKQIYIPTTTYVGWSVGTRIRMFHNATNYMEGIITSPMSYPTPGATFISIDIDYVVGSGTYSTWKVCIAGDPGKKVIQLKASDETTALTTGTNKISFRMPHGMILNEVRASLATAQTSGNIFTVDINENGTSVLSTKLTINNAQKTSKTAVTPPVISDTVLTDDSEITIDIDQIGNGTAKGLTITLIGY